MSTAKLTLRPPPNIDFVQGYPGIPPGAPDRPQAAVKGAIEVRVGPQGVKAKWVKVELRKVETLPGGGLTNTFFDFVGQGPIDLWQSSEEYSTLSSQDFPFYIRIPESIPPSIALEKGAGIKYELIATLCIKGKKGFLRRDKHNILATSSSIIIDKHELHSVWPVYAQAETRKIASDGVSLTVERTHTCYGPGDRISVMATVRSDSLATVILRGFEFSLRETTVFRAGPHTTGKKGSPQVKVGNVGEQKVPVNATLYGGTQHRAELAVTVPSHHTSTTLQSARHIDITYVLTVKALMGTGKPLIMDLPVIISNWPRSVSVEAVTRIGMASNVAPHPNGQARPPIAQPIASTTASGALSQPIISRTSLSRPHPFSMASIAASSDRPGTSTSSDGTSRYNTAPAFSAGYSRMAADEFGFDQSKGLSNDLGAVQTIGGTQVSAAIVPPVSDASSSTGVAPANVPRPRSSGRGAAPAANRLTVANYNEDIPEEQAAAAAAVQAAAAARTHSRQTSLAARQSAAASNAQSQSQSSRSAASWMPAEEEKRRLYERAMSNVERVQGGVARSQSPPMQSPSIKSAHVDAGPILKGNASTSGPSGSSSAWLTAEEEKMKLFNQATAAVQRVQGIESVPSGSTSSMHTRSFSASVAPPTLSAGAALYSSAMSSINRNASAGNSSAAAAKPASLPIKSPTPQYATADQEKAVLRRYHEAKAAVDRNQGPAGYDNPDIVEPPNSAPISYDALYPPNSPSRPTMNGSSMPHTNGTNGVHSPPRNGDLPPAFDLSSSSQLQQPSYLTEKEKLRRMYEAQDTAAGVQKSPAISAVGVQGFIKPASSPPPQVPQMSPQTQVQQVPISAFAEKEMLRKRYEAQGAASSVHPSDGAPPPTPPSRKRGANSPPQGARGALPTPRSQPLPPGGSSSFQPLSAADEKARLKAMYEAEERGSSGAAPPSSPPPFTSRHPYATPTTNGTTMQRQPSLSIIPDGIPPPPPLMPRPPKEYIQETQEEDARTHAQIKAIDDSGVDLSKVSLADPSLSLAPFTPFTSGFDSNGHMKDSTPRPPLPAKVSLLD